MRKVFWAVFIIGLIVALYFIYPWFRAEQMNNEAVMLIDEGEYQEAVFILEDALELNPNNRVMRKNLATAYEQLGRSSEAREVYPEGY